jgi:GDP-L-fucose synthase
MNKKKILICGATGFIGRNLVEFFAGQAGYEVTALYHKEAVPDKLKQDKRISFIQSDLRDHGDVKRAVSGQQVVVQAAATTSGAKAIVTRPYHHVTDNAVMNSLLFRACHEEKAEHVVFFSCTSVYEPKKDPVTEDDFNGQMIDKYFGIGWTKVYIEKMCKFYADLGPTKYTAIRHSNIYGPYDKYDFERSHVFGATVAKVMGATNGKIEVWGDGSDERDLLHVDDLVHFVGIALRSQKKPFELLNLGSGRTVSVRELVEKVIERSGKSLKMEFDKAKPTIGFKLSVNSSRAKKTFDWEPRVKLEDGITRTLDWYKQEQR